MHGLTLTHYSGSNPTDSDITSYQYIMEKKETYKFDEKNMA